MANLKPAYYYTFRNVLMIAFIIEIKNSLIFKSMNLTNLSQVAKLNSVYIFIV